MEMSMKFSSPIRAEKSWSMGEKKTSAKFSKMAAVAPLAFYLLLFFPFVKGSSQPSPLSDDTSTTDGIVHLTTLDGDLFDVNQAILYDSDLIKQEIYNGRAGSNIKLHNTTSRALSKLIHYVKYFNRTEFVVSEWEEDLRENWQVLTDIVLAANELRMESVLDMATGIMGGMMIGKSPVEIRRMFNCGNEIIDETGAEQGILPESSLFGEPMEEPKGVLVPIN